MSPLTQDPREFESSARLPHEEKRSVCLLSGVAAPWHSGCLRQGVPMKTLSNPKPARAQLLADHRSLDEQYRILLEAARAGDLQTLSTLWTSFERRLGAHMEGEERYILPLLESRHPKVVKTIREEHERIRSLVATVGVSTDLHSVRLLAFEALGELLSDHAAREDKSIYQMAANEVDCRPLLSFLQRKSPLVN